MNAGAARSVAAIEHFVAYRTFCCLSSDNVLHVLKKNLRHAVFGSGVCNVFLLLRSFGTKLSMDDTSFLATVGMWDKKK